MKKGLFSVVSIFVLFSFTSVDEVIQLEEKPEVILKSWYPEFVEFPKLKVGESKILFANIPSFEKLPIRDNDIDLKTSNGQVQIEETEKSNQYIITIGNTKAKTVEFELWFDLGVHTIQLQQDDEWKNIEDLYPKVDNRILIATISLELIS